MEPGAPAPFKKSSKGLGAPPPAGGVCRGGTAPAEAPKGEAPAPEESGARTPPLDDGGEDNDDNSELEEDDVVDAELPVPLPNEANNDNSAKASSFFLG